MPQPTAFITNVNRNPRTGTNPARLKTRRPIRTAPIAETLLRPEGAQGAVAEEVEDGQPAEHLDDEPGHGERQGDGDADEDEAQQGGEEARAS